MRSSKARAEPDSAQESDALDQAAADLAELPQPRRPMRAASIALVLVAALAAGFTAWSLRGEAFYALRGEDPLEVGDITSVELGASLENRYVHARGDIDLTREVRYRRLGEGDGFRLAPVAGGPDVWVELRVPERYDTPRYVPPTQFAGRLVPASALGLRFRGVVSALTRAGAGKHTWVLVDGGDPVSYRWVLLLWGLLVGCLAWAVASLVRMLRRLPNAERTATAPTARPA